ncbi:YihY/virulence factor BrkB family protein [Halobacteriales archaeon Cl-PHB]
MSRIEDPRAVVSAVVAVSRENRVTVLAAGLAYYAFSSLIPAGLLLFVGVAAVGQFETAATVVTSVAGGDTLQLTDVLRSVTTNGAAQVKAAAIAAAVFLWSTTQLFRAIHKAFTAVYDADRERTLVGTLLDVGVAFGTLVLALVLVGVLGVALGTVFGTFVPALASPLVLFLALLVAFLPMYYLFPHTDVTLGEALPGAVFAAVAWTLSGVGFRLYAETAQSVEIYGVAGGLLLLLTWIYLGGLALLLGVTLNAVLADRVAPVD